MISMTPVEIIDRVSLLDALPVWIEKPEKRLESDPIRAIEISVFLGLWIRAQKLEAKMIECWLKNDGSMIRIENTDHSVLSITLIIYRFKH